MTVRLCRFGGGPLTDFCARRTKRYGNGFVGACRDCEREEARERYRRLYRKKTS